MNKMEQTINYEAKVREVYSDAFCTRHLITDKFVIYDSVRSSCIIEIGYGDLISELSAWQNAYESLLKQSKIKQQDEKTAD